VPQFYHPKKKKTTVSGRARLPAPRAPAHGGADSETAKNEVLSQM